jgi:hypothetical protein
MGLGLPALRFVLDTRKTIGPFGQLLQIGHQGMHIWPELNAYADDIVRQSGLSSSLNDLIGTDPYPDQMFRNLGSTHVDVMDNSTYEGANVIHDLNLLIPKKLHGRYDTVYDGGSLEHIFNVPPPLPT